MAYLTATEVEDRLLSRYGLDASVLPGHVRAAEAALDSRGRFHGTRLTLNQAHEFPRSYLARGDIAGEVPEPVLDWIALEAYRLASPDEPGLTSKSVDGIGAKSYARPSRPQADRWQEPLLKPYERGTAAPITRRVERPYFTGETLNIFGPLA